MARSGAIGFFAAALLLLTTACGQSSSLPAGPADIGGGGCTPAATRCNAAGTAVETCNDAGTAWGAEAACPAGQACRDGVCVDPSCVAQDHKICHEGDAFWADSCGNRGSLAESCSGRPCLDGQCCTAQCSGRECGDDGCGGTCGACPSGQACGDDGQCGCGFETCGGTCCAEGQVCASGGRCCTPDCAGRDCGPNGCGGACPPNDCDDGSACTEDSCDTDEGRCRHAAAEDGTACDVDADPCTDDTCAAGVCEPGANACVCDVPSECLPFEDGDLCNGTLTCVDHRCVPIADSVVDCPPVPATNQCQTNSCVPATGLCALMPVPDGARCDDGNLCTVDDQCTSGVCAGTAAQCDDENVCTADLCNTSTGLCSHMPAAGACDDGDPCTWSDTCFQGTCLGTPRECNDSNLCTEDMCDAATGQCLFNLITCSDGDVCTRDYCEPQTGCQYEPLFDSPLPLGADCNDHCQCQSHYCYDGPYMAPFRFCTKKNCAAPLEEGGGCPESEEYDILCLIFTSALIYEYDLDHDSLCLPRCYDLAGCRELSDEYTSCPNWTNWDDVGIGPPTCQVGEP